LPRDHARTPHAPAPEATRKALDCYKRAILFEAGLGEPKKIAVDLEREAFLAGYYKAFGLGAGQRIRHRRRAQ
jgi:hypothetical protein